MAKYKAKTNAERAAEIVDQLLTLLDSWTDGDAIPWRRPFDAAVGMPANVASGRPYRGANILTLGIAGMVHGYSAPWWCTFNQARKLGGHVRKGERSQVVFFFKWLESQATDAETGEKTGKRFPVIRTYRVFNVDQLDGVTAPAAEKRDPIDPVEAAERILSDAIAAGRCATVQTTGAPAYSPRFDSIRMPARDSFRSAGDYYSTLFHESIHSTGAGHRIARPGITDPVQFGSHQYSREELVAEFGAAILCASAGIVDTRTVENSAAYLHSWRQALKNDPTILTSGAAAGQKAADYIMGATAAEKPNPKPPAVVVAERAPVAPASLVPCTDPDCFCDGGMINV